MRSLTANLQISISDFLLKLGEDGLEIWFWAGFILMGILFFLTVTAFFNLQISVAKKPGLLNRWISSHYVFSFFIVLTIIIMRLPGVSRLECNPDEGLWGSATLTLLQDPRFWVSVDGSSGGPLVVYPLMLMGKLGIAINYGSVKLLGIIFWALSIVFFYYALINYFKEFIARVTILPLVACVSTFTFWDYVAYNSEHTPILLLSISLFLYSKVESIENEKNKTNYILLTGFVLGCVPYAKLQAVPMALAIALFLVLFKSKKEIAYSIIGGILPTVIVGVYLLLSDIFYDFWQSYILSNINYANTGIAGQGYSITNQLVNFPKFALLVKDTRFYFISQCIIIIASGVVLVTIRKEILPKYYKLIALALLIICASLYGIVKPGNYFYHYILFLILPTSFIASVLLGIFLTYYISTRHQSWYSVVLILFSFLIIASLIVPLTKSNIAFEQIAMNNYNSKVKSAVTEKLLEYATPGEKMAQWGWANQYFIESGMIQGTRDVASYFQIKKNPQQAYYLNRYITDLKNNKPAIFIEAVGPNQFYFQDSVTQGYKNFPQIKAVINKNYKFIATVDGVNIYAAKDRKSKINLKEYITTITTLPQEQAAIQHNIENVIPDSTILTVSGWAFIKDQSAEYNTIQLVLQSDTTIYLVKTKSYFRPDVTAHFKNFNLDRSGFLAPILTSALHDGNYKLGVLIKDERNKVETLSFTDRVITINNLRSKQ